MFFISALLASFALADGDPEKHIVRARKILERRDYEKSSELLNHLMRAHNGTKEAISAKLLMADLFYQKQEWPTARIYYQQFLKDHPSHPEAPRALLQVGETHNKDAPKAPGRDQRATQAAINIWKQFLMRYPESDYREEVETKILASKEKLAQKELGIAIFYSKKQEWEAVRRRTEFIMQTYPASSHVPEALFLNTLAYALLGKGEIATKKRETLQTLDPLLVERLESRIQKGK
jgi:outer membrane protein assembly factor BamD